MSQNLFISIRYNNSVVTTAPLPLESYGNRDNYVIDTIKQNLNIVEIVLYERYSSDYDSVVGRYVRLPDTILSLNEVEYFKDESTGVIYMDWERNGYSFNIVVDGDSINYSFSMKRSDLEQSKLFAGALTYACSLAEQFKETF